ncbi:concanavalin A-like lectin/glucanase domain-containing protein, partial [Ochromonadaceae sp. CCMP2298]
TYTSEQGGYRMVRATQGVYQGSYYFEVEVLSPGTQGHAHVRVGWSGRSGELQAPVGFDRHSFAYRDVQGSKVHDSDRQSYGESYGPGDVVGCSLTMNEDPSRTRLCFYKNGVSQGVAYSGAEVPLGVYFPAVSLYMDVSTLTALCLTYVI